MLSARSVCSSFPLTSMRNGVDACAWSFAISEPFHFTLHVGSVVLRARKLVSGCPSLFHEQLLQNPTSIVPFSAHDVAMLVRSVFSSIVFASSDPSMSKRSTCSVASVMSLSAVSSSRRRRYVFTAWMNGSSSLRTGTVIVSSPRTVIVVPVRSRVIVSSVLDRLIARE